LNGCAGYSEHLFRKIGNPCQDDPSAFLHCRSKKGVPAKDIQQIRLSFMNMQVRLWKELDGSKAPESVAKTHILQFGKSLFSTANNSGLLRGYSLSIIERMDGKITQRGLSGRMHQQAKPPIRPVPHCETSQRPFAGPSPTQIALSKSTCRSERQGPDSALICTHTIQQMASLT
jgi:hypothetical protein